MRAHLQNISTKVTPQTIRILGREDMQKNNAGGYAWKIDDWQLMQRFCILGSESGTYYVGEKKLTRNACKATLRCIKEDGKRAVELIKDISVGGRAAKNDYALFALAMASGEGDLQTRRLAFEVLPSVARIGTHLFMFVSFMQQFRGWGRLAREGVANWYNQMSADKLAYQIVKYRNREGWTHKDVLRKAHPVPSNKTHDFLYHYILHGKESNKGIDAPEDLTDIAILVGYENVQKTTSIPDIVDNIKGFNLTREMIPIQHLQDLDIWEALLENMPLTAMIRNLVNMGKIGLLVPGNFAATEKVCNKLTNQEHLRKSRVHPLNVLSALSAYSSGHSLRGVWEPVGDVIEALDSAFYKAFDNVESCNKRICIGLDVSGSMCGASYGGYGRFPNINGIANMSPRMGASAMAMVMYKTEPKVSVMAFGSQFVPIDISRHQRLNDLMKATKQLGMSGTDCAVPMLWALEANKQNSSVVYDAFIILTDNETWAGRIHPIQALNQYRDQVNSNAKLVVVGMTATNITIGDPQDSGVLNVVGFDTAAPATINSFLRGEL